MPTNVRFMRSNADYTEVETHLLVTEASSLELRPGFLPLRIETDFGNGRDFLFVGNFEDYAEYRQSEGCLRLRIYNS